MSGRGGGGAPSQRDEKTISFVMLRFSFRLLSACSPRLYMVNLFLARVGLPSTY